MNKNCVAMLFSGLIVSFLLAGCSNGSSAAAAGNYAMEENSESFETIATGSTEMGDILVELTPHDFKEGKLEVDIAANTHSVNLEQFNLKDATILELDGRYIKPVLAPVLNGHHSSGTLVFGVNEKPGVFKITIKGIPNVEERVFEWR